MSSAGHPNDGLRPSLVQEQLRRLLFVVPYVARHPGISVEELAAALSVTKEALLSDLDLLTLVGRPPFQPDDFVDIYVENGRVYVELDQRFSKPPRLTASEAASLAAAAELLHPASSDALSSGLRKLEGALSEDARRRFSQLGRQIHAAQGAPSQLGPLTQAIWERMEVELEYFSAHRGGVDRRRVQPHELFSHRGHWYLSAYCVRSSEQRLFRLDRVREVAVLDQRFEREGISPLAAAEPSPGGPCARVRFSEGAAPYVRERFGSGVSEVPGGGVEVSVPLDSEAWLTQWVLSFGGEAEIVEPVSARESIRRILQGL